MDYLPIQASLVPCEQVFSSSAETMTKHRNRISPILMEALQMTKFFLKKERLNFMNGWITPEKEMQQDIEGEDWLAKVIDANLTKSELAQAVDDIMIAIAKDEADDMDEGISLCY